MAALSDITSRYAEADRALIERAFAFAKEAHGEQKRASGEPYITHPLHVAAFLADLGFDATSVAAAFMHDVLEDTSVTRASVEKQFGPDVAFLIDGVTKLGSIKYHPAAAKDANKKSLIFTSNPSRKCSLLWPRICVSSSSNSPTACTTCRPWDSSIRNPEAAKRSRRSRIYAPIAARLGMGRLKGELEDLAFPYAYPQEYSWLKKTVKGNMKIVCATPNAPHPSSDAISSMRAYRSWTCMPAPNACGRCTKNSSGTRWIRIRSWTWWLSVSSCLM